MNLIRNRNNNNSVITYTVNKNNYSDMFISVQNGEVIISAPWNMRSYQIQKVVEEKKQWILNKINEYEIECEKKKEFITLKTVQVLGKEYDLKIKYRMLKNPELSIEENDIKVILPNKYKKMEKEQILNLLIEKMYKMIAQKEIEGLMEKIRIQTGLAPEDYRIEKMKNRLGKCDNNIIIIDPSIAMYKTDIIEYIVLHEFCHLKYKNHTKSFYNMIKTYMPNYESYLNEIKNI